MATDGGWFGFMEPSGRRQEVEALRAGCPGHGGAGILPNTVYLVPPKAFLSLGVIPQAGTVFRTVRENGGTRDA